MILEIYEVCKKFIERSPHLLIFRLIIAVNASINTSVLVFDIS